MNSKSLAAVAFLSAALFAPHALAEDGPKAWLGQALEHAAKGKSQEAVDLLSKVIKETPTLSQAYYFRGREQFRLGKIKESVADFDKMVELDPKAEPPLWERGISLYFAGEYERGAKQFEMYQTYLNDDVENAVWRFLCLARKDGLEKARKTLLPIEGDARVPMKEIYQLYRGDLEPKDVMKAAESVGDGARQKSPLFYAHLYLGLLAELKGEPEVAKRHLAEAAGKYRIDHYMGDVARICAERTAKGEGKEKVK